MSDYINEIHLAVTSMVNQIYAWEHAYIIRSPIAGIVTIFDITDGQTVAQADELFVVSPIEKGSMVGKIRIPVDGSAKVKRLQTVNIKLADYPYQEFGQLTGNVTNISFVPKDSSYWVLVNFPMGLKTNMNDTLVFRQQMSGTCEIITERRSVFDRILGKFHLR